MRRGSNRERRCGDSLLPSPITYQPSPSSVTRRQIIRGSLALGVAGVAGLSRLAAERAAASGQLPGANLAELATYTGWRQTWDLVVPLSVDRAFPRTALLYDRAAGEATLLSIDRAGGFREVRQFFNWRRTWDVIFSSGFPRVLGITGLIAYDRAAGVLSTMQIDQFGTLQELQLYTTWRKTWSAFAPVGTAGFLAYDRAGGFASLFAVDAAGVVREVRSYNDWRQTWDLLTTGPFTTGAMPAGDLLLYDRGARQAEGLTMLGTGETIPFATYNGWRDTWTSLQGGLFLFQGYSGSGTADLLLFDQSAQEVEFLDIGPDNLQTSVLLAPTPGGRAWTSVTAIGPDLLLFYDRPAGVAGFSTTDRVPASLPTPTPVPPTPAPIPPTPTPLPPVTGSLTIRLQQGGGNNWHTYTTNATRPNTPPGQKAYVTGVRNNADKRIALIHRDRSDRRTGPVFLKAGELSDAFNGMEVRGEWEARVTTGRSGAPARIPLDILYEIR